MNIDDLTVKEIRAINSLFNTHQVISKPQVINPIYNEFIGKICVIRTYSAGVHIGCVEQVSGENVLLSNAFRLYRWSGAFTLNEVAQKGVNSENSRVSEKITCILLINAIEIIPTTENARDSYEKCSN